MANPTRRLRLVLVALAATIGLLGLATGIVVLGVHLARHWVAFVATVAGLVAALTLAAALAGRLAHLVVRRPVVIELDLADLPPEASRSPLGRRSAGGRLTLQEVVNALERAGHDRRVRGVLVLSRFGSGGLAQIQELRDALARFQAAGKFAVAFADSFGELSGANAPYYLAAACGEVLLQPTGTLGLVGFARETTFLRHALDQLGVEAIFEGRREYKSAASRLVDDHLTGPDREQQQRVVEAQLEQVVAGIAAGRKLPPADVRALVDRGPFLAGEALAAGLVDRLCYLDEARDTVTGSAGRRARRCPAADYARSAPPRARRGPRIAVIPVTGQIARHARLGPWALAGRPLDASRLAAAIEAASSSKRVRAIVLRVDSPGGSPVASDTIRRAVVQARRAGTPVVVSMGDVAASGGYYLATGADWIVAQPGTITGSIGVFAGKLVLAEAKRRVGISTDEVHEGRNALITSPNTPFSPSERERFAAFLDAIYADFVASVAEGRSMPLEAVEEVARGRIWTGADARAAGLVDALGGFPEALAAAREKAGIDPAARVRVVRVEVRARGLAGFLPAPGGAWSSIRLRLPPGADHWTLR